MENFIFCVAGVVDGRVWCTMGKGRKKGDRKKERSEESLFSLLLDRKIRVWLDTGEVVEGVLKRVSRFEILVVTDKESAFGYVILHKGHIVKVMPLEES